MDSNLILVTPIPSGYLYQVAVPVSGIHGIKQRAIVNAISPVLGVTLREYGIDNDYRVAYWAGQVCEESDNFCATEEYASGEAYEGRKDLGNTERGDGIRFKGRGLIMITGRANYLSAGKALGLDLITSPQLAAEPVNALRIACLYWQTHGLNALADLDDMDGITKRINGGLNGLASRQAATDRAFRALGYS